MPFEKQNHLKLFTITSIRVRIKAFFYQASVLKISNLTFTASVPLTTINCLAKRTVNSCRDKVGQRAIKKEKKILDIFTINSIRGGIKPHFNRASVLKITNFDRPTSHKYRHVMSLLVCTVVCA